MLAELFMLLYDCKYAILRLVLYFLPKIWNNGYRIVANSFKHHTTICALQAG